MMPASTDTEAQVLAVLTKTRQILIADTKFLAVETQLTQAIVEAALNRLQTAGRVQGDAEGRWFLI